MRQFMKILLVVSSLVSCKHAEAVADSSAAKSEVTKTSQCGSIDGFQGVCTVTEVTGRLETSTDMARQAQVGRVKKLLVQVPARADVKMATLQFATEAATLESWSIDQALDLYSRKSCLAQMSGGIFGEGYAPILTVKTLFNVEDEGRTGFAEVSDYAAGKPVHASLRLSCEWNR